MTVQETLLRFEQYWRGAWMRALTSALPGPRTTKLPPLIGTERRVLFLRYERIGDLIMATGMMRVLAQSQPGIVLDVVATPTTQTVLEHNPYVRKVFALDKQSWRSYVDVARAIRQERYEIIVDGRINTPKLYTTTPLLMLAAGSPYRVGVSGERSDAVYNVRVAPWDRVIHYIDGAKELARPFGVNVDSVDWQPEIFLSDAERVAAEEEWARAAALVDGAYDSDARSNTRRLLVNLSASEPKRRWGDAQFIEVLRAVRAVAPALRIVVIGLPAEWESVQRVANAVSAYPAKTPALRQALALVGTSDCVFTPDTSISHAASAFRKPAVVLLKGDHAPYAPWNIPGGIVYWRDERIHDLPVEAVAGPVVRLVIG